MKYGFVRVAAAVPAVKVADCKFNAQQIETEGGLEFADQHVIGVAKGCDEEMIKDLNNHFMGKCMVRR